jgi:alanine racemase
MATGTLTIDLDALAANWHALSHLSGGPAGAVVKADAYGCGAEVVAPRLAREGARRFFVATSEEGARLRGILGHGAEINVFSGHMAGDTALIRDHALTPMLNSPGQVARHREALPDAPYGVQLDSGMNRLGMEAPDWAATRAALEAGPLTLIMSHLACSDDPDAPENAMQLKQFTEMTAGATAPRSLSATGGIGLGPSYRFDVTRPGIGLYGGLPFAEAQSVVQLSLPVIQVRDVAEGEFVGYGAAFVAKRPTRIATVSAGYADGLIRYMSNAAHLHDGERPCRLAGRVSMDLLTVDITDLPGTPEHLDILGAHQGVDALARAAGTIGYEILTALGPRYQRRYLGA